MMTESGCVLSAGPILSPVGEVLLRDESHLSSIQDHMLGHISSRVSALEIERGEIEAGMDFSVLSGWSSSALGRRLRRVEKKLVYYSKVRSAIELGYVIVPDMWGSEFAVRTNLECPKGKWGTSRWCAEHHGSVKASCSPIGEGRTVSDRCSIYTETRERVDPKTGERKSRQWFRPAEFCECEFPVAVAKPALMSATSLAMGHGVFDSFAVVTHQTDPIILGRIIDPTRSRRVCAFLIGWFVDPREI